MGHVELDAEELGKSVNILVHGQQHLDTNEDEDDAQTVLQVLKVLGHSGQREVEGTEAEDGEDVGGKHDERVAADGEYSGNGVDGKSHIGGLDDQQGNEEGGGEIF